MTDNPKVKDNRDEYADATIIARTMTKDPGVKLQDGSGDVTKSMFMVKLSCPQCGKMTLHVEFPDQYEAWIKCPCGFFMGMSNDDWHRMENSRNIDEKIRKMAIKRGILKVEHLKHHII
jgi:hypothetical protein